MIPHCELVGASAAGGMELRVADPSLIKDLHALVGVQDVLENEPMRDHTSFRIGGPADVFVTPHSCEQAAGAIAACRAAEAPVCVMGHGSNLLVADEGLRGVVVQLSGNMAAIATEGDTIRAEAGASNAKVAATACKEGLAGFEFAAGIPGALGGAAVMNAGAYGGEFRDVCFAVDCLTPEGELVRLDAEQAGWGYRTSRIADEGMVVLGVQIGLHEDDPAAIQERMDDLAGRRRAKQPLELPSAGSTFKRPEGDFAGRLIQEAGMQGHRVGDAQVSTKHAGFVVNLGSATAADVLQVIRDVRRAVNEQFGVLLQPEVKLWGFSEAPFQE